MLCVALVIVSLRRRGDGARADELAEQSHKDRTEELAATIDQLKIAFAALSGDALSKNTDEFLKLAGTRLEKQTAAGEQALEAKKKLIDARLADMGGKLGELNKLIHAVEKQRSQTHGFLTGHIEKATQATHRLQETTGQLREALANPQRRGQWGERMAEDVLRLAGFVEGVNYAKQKQISSGTRPDFTFRLPGDRVVHMDVKFPLANYLKMLDASDESARAGALSQFLKDVRDRVKEVTTRSYIDPAEGTVDYVLVFIPNESVYSLIHERDSDLLDYAMRSKVVLCSPMTLYAILAVIRQGIENFHLEQNAKQILALLAGFRKQWGKYVESMEKMGERLGKAQDEYQQLVGVRTKQLDRQLDKIDSLHDARRSPDALLDSTVPSVLTTDN